MFTVKFMKFATASNNNNEGLSISCPMYSSYKRPNGSVSIVTYKDHTETSGIERSVHGGNDALDSDYDVCFVENEAGKTIAKYRHSGSKQGNGGI